jgi:hypothetical protein
MLHPRAWASRLVRTAAAVLALAAIGAAAASAQDRFTIDGDIDVRWVHASGDPSFLNGGFGLLRFDSQHEGLILGRAFLAPGWRITDIVSLHAVIDTYGDHNRNPVDLSELYLDIRPFPTGAIRWRGRIGAFYMPVSLENRGVGWTDVYSITPSAVNSWIGEEFRTIGAEIEARWLGASSGYLGDFALVGAVYGWNDPAGVMLAQKGFTLTDRPSTLFGYLGSPPIDFYHEVDKRPGYYAGATWRHHDRLEVRALHYDNLADPNAETQSGFYAWHTRFDSAGARLEPDAHWTLIAQAINGDTVVGVDDEDDPLFLLRFRAAFALTSYEWGRERVTARYDEFHTHQVSGFYGPPRDQNGHAWTLAYSYEPGEHWQILAEWIRAFSSFPPRMELDEPTADVESQVQIAVRYRFDLGW